MPNPMFQHRHYRAIAKVLAEARAEEKSIFDGGPTSLARQAALDRAEHRLIDLFARDNGNFDVGRFEAAAKGQPSNGKDR